jgi:hypothetical protein
MLIFNYIILKLIYKVVTYSGMLSIDKSTQYYSYNYYLLSGLCSILFIILKRCSEASTQNMYMIADKLYD